GNVPARADAVQGSGAVEATAVQQRAGQDTARMAADRHLRGGRAADRGGSAGNRVHRTLTCAFCFSPPPSLSPSSRPGTLTTLDRCVALAQHHAVPVVSPYTWLRLWSRADTRESYLRGLPVSRPGFFYPPGVLRGTHAWWMWQGIRRAASRTLAAFRPDAVLSYWTYPDTAVAARLATLADGPCVATVRRPHHLS